MHYKKLYLEKGKTKDEHRYIMEQHLGRKLNRNEVVHHLDENKQNNDISNLKVMSLSEHSRLHRTGAPITEEFREKMRVIGIEHAPKRKLTIDQVLEIRDRKASGETHNSLATAFGVSKSTVCDITNYKTYKQPA